MLSRLAFIQSFAASILAYLLRGYCRPCQPVPQEWGKSVVFMSGNPRNGVAYSRVAKIGRDIEQHFTEEQP